MHPTTLRLYGRYADGGWKPRLSYFDDRAMPYKKEADVTWEFGRTRVVAHTIEFGHTVQGLDRMPTPSSSDIRSRPWSTASSKVEWSSTAYGNTRLVSPTSKPNLVVTATWKRSFLPLSKFERESSRTEVPLTA